MANAYVIKEDYPNALIWANQGLEKMTVPKESWLQMAVALNFQVEDFELCRELLETLLTRWPKGCPQ